MYATMTKHHVKRREPVAILVVVLLLGAMVLTWVGLLAPSLWTAVVKTRHSSPTGKDCSMLMDPAARRACDLDLGARSPAKSD